MPVRLGFLKTTLKVKYYALVQGDLSAVHVQHISFHVGLHLDDVILAVILECWANIFRSTKQPVPVDFMDIKVLGKSKSLQILRSAINKRQRFSSITHFEKCKNVTN